MNLRIFDSAEDVTRAIAAAIVRQTTGRERTAIAISGGSTPIPLYELLGRDETLARQEITWVVVDERYVPPADPQSNSRMIRVTLFSRGVSPTHRFLEFKTDLDDPQKTVQQFEVDWRALGLTKLDVVLLGVGEDGHTASLFPGTPVLEIQEGIAAAVWVPRLEQWRVTLTMPAIRAATLRIVQAVGSGKAGIVRDVAAGVEHPVALATGGIETWWFVDRDAAGSTAPE